jgi:hypothetical protein
MGQKVLRILDQNGIKVRIKLKSKVKNKIDEGEISETSTQYRVYLLRRYLMLLGKF